MTVTITFHANIWGLVNVMVILRVQNSYHRVIDTVLTAFKIKSVFLKTEWGLSMYQTIAIKSKLIKNKAVIKTWQTITNNKETHIVVLYVT